MKSTNFKLIIITITTVLVFSLFIGCNCKVSEHKYKKQHQVPQSSSTTGSETLKKKPHSHNNHQHESIIFNENADIAHEKEHLAEHTDVPLDTLNMDDEEFYYHQFRIYDKDHNNILDGTELVGSMIHWHEEETRKKNAIDNSTEEYEDDDSEKLHHDFKIFTDDEIIQTVDNYLEEYDTDNDGCIDYVEFTYGIRKEGIRS